MQHARCSVDMWSKSLSIEMKVCLARLSGTISVLTCTDVQVKQKVERDRSERERVEKEKAERRRREREERAAVAAKQAQEDQLRADQLKREKIAKNRLAHMHQGLSIPP